MIESIMNVIPTCRRNPLQPKDACAVKRPSTTKEAALFERPQSGEDSCNINRRDLITGCAFPLDFLRQKFCSGTLSLIRATDAIRAMRAAGELATHAARQSRSRSF
jgi:hypothetical protein